MSYAEFFIILLQVSHYHEVATTMIYLDVEYILYITQHNNKKKNKKYTAFVHVLLLEQKRIQTNKFYI
jgi:hypothetical protein